MNVRLKYALPHTRTTKKLTHMINTVGKENGVSVEETPSGWLLRRKDFDDTTFVVTLAALIDQLYMVVGMAIPDEELEEILYHCPAMFVYEMCKEGWRYNPYDNAWTKEGREALDHPTVLQIWAMGRE